MRFFQPRDYIAVDYVHESRFYQRIGASGGGAWPGVQTRVLEINNIEPLRAEIESFLTAAETRTRPIVSGEDGRRALSLALRTLAQISDHTVRTGVHALFGHP